MKTIIVGLAFLVAAANAGLVKDGLKKNDVLQGGETMVKNFIPHGVRNKRDCGVADLNKLEAKITEALEKQIALLLEPYLHEGGNRTRRATSEAAAASKVDPDGTIKSTAAAKGSNDAAPAIPGPLMPNGHQLPPMGFMKKIPAEEAAGAPRLEEGQLPGGPIQTLPPPPPQQPGGTSASHPISGTGNTVQKVASKANMETGTAVASAIAKRSAVLQTVDTSGGKAVANAESHKGADTNVQSVTANGTHVGIANALVDKKNASSHASHDGPELVLQNVAAIGEKAVATATNNKGSGSGVQEASAIGDEISVASVVSSRVKRQLILISSGNDSILDEDDGSYKPENVDDQSQDEKIIFRQRVTRSPCISTKMDENLRVLIKDTVANIFTDMKKEMKL